MQITKITDKINTKTNPNRRPLTPDALQREFDYWRAEKVLRKMLNACLISQDEFEEIMELNRVSFSPMLAQLMP